MWSARNAALWQNLQRLTDLSASCKFVYSELTMLFGLARLFVFVISCILQNGKSFEILKTAPAKQMNWSGKGIQKGWLKCEKMSEGSESNKTEKWEFYIYKHFMENPRAAMKTERLASVLHWQASCFISKARLWKRLMSVFFSRPESVPRLERISPLKQYPPTLLLL